MYLGLQARMPLLEPVDQLQKAAYIGPPCGSVSSGKFVGAYWNALSQGVSASRHASKGIHLPALAMRA